MVVLRRLPRRRVAAAVAAALFLSACGGAGGSTAPATTPTAEAGAASGAEVTVGPSVSPGSAAIVASVLDAGTVIGDGIDVAALEGRAAIAWFWAPWCTSCRAEGPTVAEIAADYVDDVVVFGVPGRGAIGDMERFIADTGTGAITHVADIDGSIWSAFGVWGQPAFAFISADGDVEVFIGSLGRRGLTDRVEALIEA